MLRAVFMITLLFMNLYALKPSVEELSWPKGMLFLNFLEINKIPFSLYYNLTSEDKELVAEINADIKYQILRDEKDEILQVLIPVNDELQAHIYRDNKDNFQLDFSPISYQTEEKVLNVEIEHSVIRDIIEFTGSNELALAFRDAFKNQDIDFRKIQKGDRVVIFYTQKRRLGRVFGSVDIHAASFVTKSKEYMVYKFDGKFYDKSGKDRTKVVFTRPLSNARITSPFTLKRWHPILRRYRAHLGVDYGAPRGTPIKAAGDGRVKFAGSKTGYGKTLIISHGGGYETLYAHLNGFAKGISSGKKVTQGKIVAYVGNTGMSTGPHLHFGFYIGGKAINPESMMRVVKSIAVNGNTGTKFKALVAEFNKKFKDYTKDNLTTQKEDKFPDVIEY